MNVALSPDRLLADALARVPAAGRQRAFEITSGPACAELVGQFLTLETGGALTGRAAGEFNFVAQLHGLDDCTFPFPIVNALRECSRVLQEQGVLCARLSRILPACELAEHARDLDFQILTMDGITSNSTAIVWRKRAAGWRANLADHAVLASAPVLRVVNAWDHTPVVPSRGRYAVIEITVESLPLDLDLQDLEVTVAGARATAVSLSEASVLAVLPELEQTGLAPVDLKWFGEPLLPEPAYVRVIPPGPVVPRIVSVEAGAGGIAVLIEDLARPDEVSAVLDGVAVWGVEARCVDAGALRFIVRVGIPEGMSAGTHEVQVTAGRRKLVPIAVELE